MLSEEMINHEFSRTFKGYDVEQVEEYIEKFIGMYEQLANENKELTLRYEQLTKALEESKETVEEAARLGEERERIVEEARQKGQELIDGAEAEAQSILLLTKQKAQSSIENAENMARRLLTEAKSRAESMDAETQSIKEAAEAEAERIIEEAKEEAKKLIRATKINCVKRLDECNSELEAVKAEHDAVAKKAADFKAMLFEAYSAQILSIENIEIPQALTEEAPVQHPQENAPSDDSTDKTNVDDAFISEESDRTDEDSVISENMPDAAEDATFAPAYPLILDLPGKDAGEAEDTSDKAAEPDKTIEEQPETFSPPEADTQGAGDESELLNYDRDRADAEETSKETNYVFEGGKLKINKSAKEDEYKSFTGFQIEKERSGQVQYDSTNITSVNKTLDDIMTKKGKDKVGDRNDGYPSKLGFLK